MKTPVKTDLQLKQDALAEFQWEAMVNAALIGVEVNGGVVTLAGQVDSYAAKWAAEKATQRVAGVKALAVEMKVHITGISARTDADIARSVENMLEWTTYLSKNTIKVMVEGGWITLSEDVEWGYQRRTAENSIRYMMGVTGVSNQIDIKPKVFLVAVKSGIEQALKRHAVNDAADISVDVNGTDVTLSGTVHSWSERNTARNAAWGAPGVKSVVDKLSVSY